MRRTSTDGQAVSGRAHSGSVAYGRNLVVSCLLLAGLFATSVGRSASASTEATDSSILLGSLVLPGSDDVADEEALAAARVHGLTPIEGANLMVLSRMVIDLYQVAPELAGPDYGGLWMSTEHPGQVLVAFTERAEEQAEALAVASGFAAAEALTPIEVNNTLPELQATRERVIRDFSDLVEARGVVGHYIDEPTNRVVIEARQASDADKAWLVETYGADRVRLLEAGEERDSDIPSYSSNCRTFNTHCNPLRGGIALSSCTLGFKVNAASNRYWITAGHCGDSQSHSGVNAGAVIKQTNVGSIDAQIHHLGSGWSIANWLAESSGNQAHRIAAVERRYSMPNGVYLCFKGKSTPLQCGPIVNGNWWGVWLGVDRHNMLTIDICPLGGESGGPVYATGWAYAIAKGYRHTSTGACDWGLYTYVKNIEPWGGIEISVN